MIDLFFNLTFLISILRMATPIIFAALGGLLSERSGVINIALEGHMLLGAFTGASVALVSQSAWLGWISAGLAGMILAAVYSYFVIELESEPVVAGTAINLLMIGGIPLASKRLFDTTGATPSLLAEVRFSYEPILMALIVALLIHFWLSQTSSGLWVSFAGQRPEALAPQGISLRRVRWGSVLFCGTLAAWGGATLSLYLASAYSPLMSGGRGFMALAAMIFGRWAPLPTLAACLFFGLTEAVQIRLQGVHFGGIQVPVQLIQVIPYVVTIIVLYQPFRRKIV
ncbi:MAG: ABC transporter permease [Bdellovibrionaceae bacterium]|nr:ABC transporter permease [Pseudobdellovibrionaceae bacterium]